MASSGSTICSTREQSVKVFSTKILFSTICKSFLPPKFPTIQYIELICAGAQNHLIIYFIYILGEGKGGQWGEAALIIIHKCRQVAKMGKPGSINDVRWMLGWWRHAICVSMHSRASLTLVKQSSLIIIIQCCGLTLNMLHYPFRAQWRCNSWHSNWSNCASVGCCSSVHYCWHYHYLVEKAITWVFCSLNRKSTNI